MLRQINPSVQVLRHVRLSSCPWLAALCNFECGEELGMQSVWEGVKYFFSRLQWPRCLSLVCYWTALNTGIVVSNPGRCMNVCPWFFLCCVILCRWRPCSGPISRPRRPNKLFKWFTVSEVNSDSGRTEHLIREPWASYPKVSGMAAWSKNWKWNSSLPLCAVISLFCESV
jgi:hypothetical protein